MVYHVSWTDSDVDGDGIKDVLSFNLRVEAFSGSVVSGPLKGTVGGPYKPEGRVREVQSQEPVITGQITSMTLGKTASVPSFSDGIWGVGRDRDIDQGESLRFSVGNIRLSSDSKLTPEGFVSFELAEPRGGNSHALVVGEGENVHVATSNSATHVTIPQAQTLLLTSPRDSKVAAGSVVFAAGCHVVFAVLLGWV